MPQNFLKKRICEVAIIFTSLALVACSPSDDKPKIRIVDLDGKAHSVVTRTPELNKRALTSQGVMIEQPVNFENDLPPQQNALVQNSEDQSAIQATPDYGILSPEQEPKKQSVIEGESLVAAGKQESPTIEYDLSSPEGDATKSGAKNLKKSVVSSDSEKGLFVQAGAFSSEESAKTVLAKMQKFHKGHIEIIDGEVKLHRVLLGPFKSKNKALALVRKIKASGHDAVLMRNK